MTALDVLVYTDGRSDYIFRTLESAQEHLKFGKDWEVTWRIYDDSQDPIFARSLNSYKNVVHYPLKKGFAGTIKFAWSQVSYDVDYILSLEDDFLFNEDINVADIVKVLSFNPHLCQIALKRQPWNEPEIQAGGLVEMWPDTYMEKSYSKLFWVEHRNFYTTNPNVMPRDVIDLGWADINGSEKIFSDKVFADPKIHAAYWGKKFDPPKVTHIGQFRVGTGY